MPEWYTASQMYAEENHDPDLHDGRDWDEFSSEEQDTAIAESYETLSRVDA